MIPLRAVKFDDRRFGRAARIPFSSRSASPSRSACARWVALTSPPSAGGARGLGAGAARGGGLPGPVPPPPPLLAQRAPTAIRTSLPLERWLALLQERAKAFFRIGHREEAILQFSLEREALVHRHLEAFRDRALDEADRARGVLRIRQAVREGHRLLPELRSGEDPIQEAPVERLFRREHSARGHEVDRATLADKPRESLRASRSGKDAERHVRQSDPPGSVRGETERGRPGDFESAADAMSVDRGDEELRRALHLVQNLLAI